jgi:hypothetical protein
MPNTARATNSLVLDTHLLTANNAFSLWKEFISRQVFTTSMSSRVPESFRGRIELHAVQETRIIFTRSAPYAAERGAAEIAQTRTTGLMWLILCTR